MSKEWLLVEYQSLTQTGLGVGGTKALVQLGLKWEDWRHIKLSLV